MTTITAEAANTQTFVCLACDKAWSRPASKGRPPHVCPECREAGKAPKTAFHKPVVEVTQPAKDKVIAPKRHKAFATLLQVCKARIPAMLVGPAGSGKSTAGRQVANALELHFVTESCSPQMSKWDIMGFMNAQGGYTPGVIREAFEKGGVVLLDEIDASNPAVLVSINLIASVSVGETVTFPDGQDIPRHPDFILIAGANTFGDGASEQYVGREQLDAATLDRFATIEWGYDESLEIVAAGDEAWTKHVQRVRKAAAKANVDLLVTPRASINGAALLRSGMARKTVEELVLWKGLSADAKRTVKAALRGIEAEEAQPETEVQPETPANPWAL